VPAEPIEPDAGDVREMRRGVRLGIDVGTVRIGVASCDRDGLLATPVETVKAEPRSAGMSRIAALVAEYQAIEVVVGLPRSLSGGEGPAAAKIRAYAAGLARRLHPVPLRLVDERLSTVSATRGLRASGVGSAKGRAVVDQAAAVVILQDALDTERMSGRPPGAMVQVEDAGR
jgi:putative Holliday junction resolvase